MTDRKARLAALAAKAGRTKEVFDPDATEVRKADVDDEATGGEKERRIRFRNYTPADTSVEEELQPASKRPRPLLGRSDNDGGGGATKREQSALEQALVKSRAEIPIIANTNDSIEAMAVVEAPQKMNADLKRNIQAKLDKLEKRTQKAIVALLKERLEKDAGAAADNIDID